MNILIGIFVFLFGITIGSFLNVCIFRIPTKESIVTGPSHCMTCGEKIKPYDLIPVFSWLFLRGKCRNCKAKISIRYPLIELLNGILFLLIYFQFGLTLHSLYLAFLFPTLVVCGMIDFDTQEIPNGLMIFLLCVSPICFFTSEMPFYDRLIGFLAASLPIFIIAYFTDGFGGADIKLLAVCGLFLGWKLILIALFISIIIGGITGVILFITKKAKKGTYFAFGPAISIGIIIAALYGTDLLNMYMRLIG